MDVAEHHLRKALEEKKETLPNQLGKPTSKPSMSWVIRKFKNIQVVIFSQSECIPRIPHQNIKIFRISKKVVQERTLPLPS